MNIQPGDLRAVEDQVGYLNQQAAQPRDIQRPQRAAPADLAAFHRLQHQITRQRHVQRRQRDRHLIFLAPLYAAFAQHDQRAENRILLYRDAQLLGACAVGHALHQQAMDACLG